MNSLLSPIKTDSLTDVFIGRFEELILSGKFRAGQKLPSERELALQLGVSRPVVHEGLLDLAAKGMVTLIPRVGAVVNDYQKQGSLAILSTLFNYRFKNQSSDSEQDAELDLIEDMLATRMLFEIETARLAAINRTKDQLEHLKSLIQKEQGMDLATYPVPDKLQQVVDIDFDVHHTLAMASRNQIYPLLLNSFKPFYVELTAIFFKDLKVVPVVFEFHQQLVCAIQKQDDNAAVAVMKNILTHGEKQLRMAIHAKKEA